jgi:citrate lyase subunit beta/citryl-CoA lyase
MPDIELAPLYVPGDRPDRFAKALTTSPHVILDLEDAVAPDRKGYARAAVAEALAAPGAAFAVRVNAAGTPWHAADLAAVAGRPGLRTLRLPKVDGPGDVRELLRHLEPLGGPPPAGLTCLLESARAVEAAHAIAIADPAVTAVALGEADLRSDLGLPTDAGLTWSRSRVVVAARAAGLPPPVMSVHPHVSDVDGLVASCRAGRALGFLGRTCIHPRQVPVVVAAFAPTPAEVDRATALLAALEHAGRTGRGVLALPDGRMVDPAMAGAAHRTLATAAAATRYLPA